MVIEPLREAVALERSVVASVERLVHGLLNEIRAVLHLNAASEAAGDAIDAIHDEAASLASAVVENTPAAQGPQAVTDALSVAPPIADPAFSATHEAGTATAAPSEADESVPKPDPSAPTIQQQVDAAVATVDAQANPAPQAPAQS